MATIIHKKEILENPATVKDYILDNLLIKDTDNKLDELIRDLEYCSYDGPDFYRVSDAFAFYNDFRDEFWDYFRYSFNPEYYCPDTWRHDSVETSTLINLNEESLDKMIDKTTITMGGEIKNIIKGEPTLKYESISERMQELYCAVQAVVIDNCDSLYRSEVEKIVEQLKDARGDIEAIAEILGDNYIVIPDDGGQDDE